MAHLLGRPLTLLAGLIGFTGPAMAGAAGWSLEANVRDPSYAMAEPTSTNLNIDVVVLSCEQGPERRGLQLRLYLSDAGPLAPKVATTALKDDPRVELVVDGVSRPAELLFADNFVVVADSADGTMPLLSDAFLDKLQSGRRLELKFDLVQEPRDQAPSFDASAVVDLQAGVGSRAVAAVRHCADGSTQHLAETPRPSR
ncbi:hypothetical protein [Reyranella soli]|uniref:Uncharacterized protein n=1 Tax=Reyranella soli TaxID=1230389 RepID=A0A512NC29_9HYPH|nr:hypothetical protein [Reyranella soli]GEP56499.1 hypothetical protein RSO01_36650 [Reyranella soli]